MKRLAIVGLAGAALCVVGCQSLLGDHSEYSDRITHAEQWQREDKVTATSQAYDQAHGGYSGAFACHTPDGGCLHMVCSTKTSCDYMAEAEKRCAAPTSNDPKILDRIVVKDDKCESVEVPQTKTTAMVSGTTGVMTLGSNCTQGYNGGIICR